MKGMLKVFAAALSISVVACLAFAQGKDLTGRWTVTMERGTRSATLTMNLKAAGNRVTGSIDLTPDITVQIENGKLEGNQLTFDVAAPEHGHTKEIHFVGDVGDDAITLRNESRGKQGRTMIYQREKE